MASTFDKDLSQCLRDEKKFGLSTSQTHISSGDSPEFVYFSHPFVLLEDALGICRPMYIEFPDINGRATYPTLDLSPGTSCPFLPPKAESCTKANKKRIIDLDLSDSKPGFCEPCNIKFNSLSQVRNQSNIFMFANDRLNSICYPQAMADSHRSRKTGPKLIYFSVICRGIKKVVRSSIQSRAY